MLQGLEVAQQLSRVPSSSSSAASIDSRQTGTSVSLQSNESSRTSDMRSDAERHIDETFGDPSSMKYDGFVPVLRRENFDELLEARLTVSWFVFEHLAGVALTCCPATLLSAYCQ